MPSGTSLWWSDPRRDAGGGEERELMWLAAFWAGVGLAAALLQAASASVLTAVEPAALARALGRGLLSGLIWVPLTLLVVRLHGGFPLHEGRRRTSLAVHAVGSLSVPLLYNLAFTALLTPDGGEGLLRRALAGYLEWLHISVAVYWAILAADAWRRGSPAARSQASAGGRQNGTSAKPSREAPVRIPVRSGRGVEVVEPSRIAWIEGAGDYVRLHTERGAFLASRRMKSLAHALDPLGFERVHRSAIVNLRHVERYRPLGHGDYELTLRDETTLRVSRSRGRRFRERMEALAAP